MFDYTKMEIVTGIFVVLGLGAVGYLSISIGGVSFTPRDVYHVTARFSNAGDLKARAPVKLAGVTIGRVESIRLADYHAEAQLSVRRGIALPKDTIASIATAGLLGEAFVALSPGGDDANLADGGRITRTEPAIDVSSLIGRTAFGNGSPGPDDEAPATKTKPARADGGPP